MPGPPSIICFGDSITAGQHVSTPWTSLVPGGDPRGVPGDTTRLALERFPRDVQASGAARVLIQFGHNDCNTWQTDKGLTRVSPAAFKANLAEMVERARHFDIEPILLTMIETGLDAWYELRNRGYDQLLRAVAREHNVQVCDVRRHMSGKAGVFLPDHLHLSEVGHAYYAEAVRGCL